MALGQQEGDEEPANATVAIEKGMDRLELCVRHPDPDDQRQLVLRVQKPLQVAERRWYLLRRRWNERGPRETRPRGTNPVLRAPKLAGRQPIAAHAREQS